MRQSSQLLAKWQTQLWSNPVGNEKTHSGDYGPSANESLRESFFEKLRDHLTRLPYEYIQPAGEAIIGLDDLIGSQRIAQFIDDFVIRLSRPHQESGETIANDEEKGFDLVVDEIKHLRDSEMAIGLADDYSSERERGVYRFSAQRLAGIAAAGLTRADEYFGRHPDIFAEKDGIEPSELLWDWHHLSARAGKGVEPIQAYVAAVLERSPERLTEILAMAAAWSNDRPSFRKTPLLAGVTDVLAMLGDGDDLISRVRAPNAPGGRYPDLVAELRALLPTE
jgi:hypothetical protein